MENTVFLLCLKFNFDRLSLCLWFYVLDLCSVNARLASKLRQRFVHRCADLMSGVTKVLQSVGVNCCTIQPEFATCSPSCQSSAAASEEDLSRPCLLDCGKTCAGFTCRSSLQQDTRTPSPPPAQEAMQEPQTLIMVNNFTEGKWINVGNFVLILIVTAVKWANDLCCLFY